MRRGLPALAAALLAVAGCSGPLPERANVLLISVDTLRPDHLSAYGYRADATPHLDRLAAEGTLFENAFADAPWTTPSMSSVLTGLYPTLHGFKSPSAQRLSQEQVTLAEVLRERGYDTAAVIGSFPLDSIFQLDQGFERYDDAFTTPIWILPGHASTPLPSQFRESPEERAMFTLEKALADSRRTDAEVTDAALARLDDLGGGPFFLWVHYFGPHTKPDWRLPESERERRHLERYDPDVRIVDAEVGRLLDALETSGLAARTLVVFHADHGESLGDQGYLGHGQLLNDATMRIPLILRLPGVVAAGVRVDDLVRNVDIFPTILDVSGGPTGRDISGESLLPLARRGVLARAFARDGDGRVAYMETFYPAHAAFARKLRLPDGREVAVGFTRRSVRTDHWRFERREPHPLLDVSPENQPELSEAQRDSVRGEALYDLTAADGEGRNVIDAHPEVAAELRARLDAYVARERVAAPGAPLDEETRLRLESLGYGD